MSYTSLLFLAVSLSFFLVHTEACSCYPDAVQHKYCNAHFVIRVKILSKVQIGGLNGEYRYGIKKLKTFRFSKDSDYSEADKTYLWTAANDGLCGVHLEVTKTYIITGSVDSDKRLTFMLCGWHEEWKKLTSYQKKAVKKTWKKQCRKCKIKVCYDCGTCVGIKCIPPFYIVQSPPDTCVLINSGNQLQCHDDYSVCHLKKGRCRFAKTQDLEECLE